MHLTNSNNSHLNGSQIIIICIWLTKNEWEREKIIIKILSFNRCFMPISNNVTDSHFTDRNYCPEWQNDKRKGKTNELKSTKSTLFWRQCVECVQNKWLRYATIEKKCIQHHSSCFASHVDLRMKKKITIFFFAFK